MDTETATMESWADGVKYATELGLKLVIDYASERQHYKGEKLPSGERVDWEHWTWKVVLKMRRDGKVSQITTEFSRGNPALPTLSDVLGSLFLDGKSAEWDSFEEWAENYYGAEYDSPEEMPTWLYKKAQKAYSTCEGMLDKLKALLGYELYDALYDLSEKY